MNTVSPELAHRLAQVKLLGLDVDGVLTDGGLYYTETGEEIKRFNVQDGLGIKRLMAHGVEVAIISANKSAATLHRAKKLNITHVYIGVEDKLKTLEQLCTTLKITPEQVAYMGDDLTDLAILETVGCPLTVPNAIASNRAIALYITQFEGGKGAVREICDLILQAKLHQS